MGVRDRVVLGFSTGGAALLELPQSDLGWSI
jgi:hypothetical protein